ncbi:MAG: SDR family NAD(P)-dependent oxidoreductase [Actinomycetota bacterium]|nr:SDR family NAD(P)-dependent oxidoreductase [Actinomycetota bacterium]
MSDQMPSGNRPRPVAVISGASAGIGAATAVRLASEGYEVVGGARRVEKAAAVLEPVGGRALALDVTDAGSVDAFAREIERVDVLVNNAGKAIGLEPLADLSDKHAREMWETNVLGLLSVTRALLPQIERSAGHIVNLGSTSGFETYPGGGGYTATKHAVRALTRTLRLELVGKPVRITEISPGLVQTEFASVRFDWDEARAAKVYEGIDPLTAEDIADCIAWAVTRPPHVDIDEIVVRPVAQAASTIIARREPSPPPREQG